MIKTKHNDKRQQQYDVAYMNMAISVANLSYARRKKVGCVIINENDQVVAQGFNGMPSGFDNNCENNWCDNYNDKCDTVMSKCEWAKNSGNCEGCEYARLKTKDEVLHAETNAISKCARSHNSTVDTTLYVTLSPCINCAKTIIQAGIKKVIYLEYYNNPEGIELLQKAGIDVIKLSVDENDDTKYRNPKFINI